MKCHNCEYAPKNYEEYCKAKRYAEPGKLCPDAFEERAVHCNGNISKEESDDENE